MLNNLIKTAMTAHTSENIPQQKCRLTKYSNENYLITLDPFSTPHINCLIKMIEICVDSISKKEKKFTCHFYILDLEKTSLHFLFQIFRTLGKYKDQGLNMSVFWTDTNKSEDITNIGKDLARMYGVSINNFLIHK